MRSALLVSLLLLTLSGASQSEPVRIKAALYPPHLLIGPFADTVAVVDQEDLYDWAAYRSVVNQSNRDKTQDYYLLLRKAVACEKETIMLRKSLAASDSAGVVAQNLYLDLATTRQEKKWNWGSFGWGFGTGMAVSVTGLVLLATKL